MHRPFLAAADHDRRDPGGLELLHRAEKIIPGLDVLGLHASLVEQLLVVIEDDLTHLERHADGLAVDLERIDGGRREFGFPRGDVLGDVLEEPGLVLGLHHAPAPAVEEVGPRLVGLQHGGQLRLERLVLEILELDLHPLVLGVVIVGDLVPDRLLRGVVADMKDSDVRFGVGWGAQSADARRKERELAKFHGLPPGRTSSGIVFVRYAN